MSRIDWTDPGDFWKRIEEDADRREANIRYARECAQKLIGWHEVDETKKLRVLQIGGFMSQYEAQEALEEIERRDREAQAAKAASGLAGLSNCRVEDNL